MQNRRKFLNTIIRGSILASLTFISGVLIHRWGEAEDCQQNFACGICTLSNRCQLPEADQHRLDKARLQNTNSDHGRTRK